MQIIAKTACSVLGVYAISFFLNGALYMALSAFLASIINSWGFVDTLQYSAQLALSILFLLVILRLLFKSEKLSARMTGPIPDDAAHVDRAWAIAAFRIALVFCGLMMLRHCIKPVATAAIFIVYVPKLITELVINRGVPDIYQMPLRNWIDFIFALLKTAFAAYLLYGAPHFVRWQIKTLRPHEDYDTRSIDSEQT